jgi:uncharacterized protein (DUF2164 family)
MAKHIELVLSDDGRKQALNSLRDFAAQHMDEELTELQAVLLLDHVLADLGPAIYNQALQHARAFVEERAADLDAALHRSEFPVSSRRKR